jgi:hypothetical protein
MEREGGEKRMKKIYPTVSEQGKNLDKKHLLIENDDLDEESKYTKSDIIIAMKNVGCPDILIKKLFDELNKE